jgi:hypothetical protein
VNEINDCQGRNKVTNPGIVVWTFSHYATSPHATGDTFPQLWRHVPNASSTEPRIQTKDSAFAVPDHATGRCSEEGLRSSVILHRRLFQGRDMSVHCNHNQSNHSERPRRLMSLIPSHLRWSGRWTLHHMTTHFLPYTTSIPDQRKALMIFSSALISQGGNSTLMAV